MQWFIFSLEPSLEREREEGRERNRKPGLGLGLGQVPEEAELGPRREQGCRRGLYTDRSRPDSTAFPYYLKKQGRREEDDGGRRDERYRVGRWAVGGKSTQPPPLMLYHYLMGGRRCPPPNLVSPPLPKFDSPIGRKAESASRGGHPGGQVTARPPCGAALRIPHFLQVTCILFNKCSAWVIDKLFH